MSRIAIRSLVPLLLALGSASPAAAQAPDGSIYSGEAPVASQDEAERTRALSAALLQALVKASGDRTLVEREGLAEILATAPALLSRFSYRQDLAAAGDTLVPEQLLVAEFEPAGIERALARLGRSVWGERPVAVLALVIDDGGAKRIANAAQVGALAALTRTARERGIRIRLPDMSGDDLAHFDPALLWSGRDEGALAGAARYGARVALVMRLMRDGAGWNARYAYLDGAERETWSARHGDANQALSAAANGLADRLARRYAVPMRERVEAEYVVWLGGLRSPQDFGAALAYLRGLSVVGAAEPIGASDDRLLLRLRLLVTPQRFGSLLEIGGVVTASPAPPGSGRPFELGWRGR